MKHRIALISFALLISSSLCAQTPVAAPIPIQIASAKTAFLSNAGDSDPATLNADYNAVYSALQAWGKYQLTPTPAEADLILELHYQHLLSNCNGGSCLESDVVILHVVDRATRTVLWSITVNGSGSNPKFAARAANDILNGLKALAQPTARTNAAPPTATKTRLSDEGKK